MFLLETCYYLAVPPSALLLPPPVVEHRQRPLLLQLQDAVRYCLGVRRTWNLTKIEIIIKRIFEFFFTWRQRHSVSLAVELVSDLGELAIPLHVVLHGRGLHEEGVVAVALHHAVDPLLVAVGVHRRLGRLHERVQLLDRGQRGVLQENRSPAA